MVAGADRASSMTRVVIAKEARQLSSLFCVDRVAVKEKGITSTQPQAFYVPLHIETKTN